MGRKSPRSISIDSNVRCLKVYPVEGTDKSTKDMKTIGIKLSKQQATHMARVLLAVTQDWEEIDITAYRMKRRGSDGTYHVTITNFSPEEE